MWIAYLILAYLTNIYLFAMVGTVWLCAIIQRRLNGLATSREALGTAALTIALVTTVIALGGQFGTGTGLPFDYYGYHSMNLLSPIMPQESGLLPGLGGLIDATGGQYEGFNYLGLGLLLASLIVLLVEVTWLRQNLKRHAALFVAFAALTAFAISHRVFAGHWLLFELRLPHYIIWNIPEQRSILLADWVRANGDSNRSQLSPRPAADRCVLGERGDYPAIRCAAAKSEDYR